MIEYNSVVKSFLAHVTGAKTLSRTGLSVVSLAFQSARENAGDRAKLHAALRTHGGNYQRLLRTAAEQINKAPTPVRRK